MSVEKSLPRISTQTRDKLQSYGFVNHLYDYTKMPSFYQPRACGFNAYTYLIMGLSATGAFLAKRFHFEPTCFIFCFLAAPTASFLQKHEADTFIMSDFSRQNPVILLQQYPILHSSFKQVNQEVNDEIAKYQLRVKHLQENLNKNEA